MVMFTDFKKALLYGSEAWTLPVQQEAWLDDY